MLSLSSFGERTSHLCTRVVIQFHKADSEAGSVGHTVSGTVTQAGKESEPQPFEGWLRLMAILEALTEPNDKAPR